MRYVTKLGYTHLPMHSAETFPPRAPECAQALTRPGRLECVVEIGLPDEHGRGQILDIHTKRLREHGKLAPVRVISMAHDSVALWHV